tara:strand:+ start:39095 stop:39412 length:318 start_codon:yes stop_codon:yes gene_type:complete
MNLLSPDKSVKLISYYHDSAKWMLPLTATSYASYKYDLKPYNNFVYLPTLLSLGYHSYVSTACIITDYIKPKNIALASRCLNIKLHGISTIGFIYYLYKNNKKSV